LGKIKAVFRLPYFPIVLAPIILFAPILLTGKALYWGTPFLQFMPWRVQAWDILRSGSWPLWNPLVGMGAPLLANYQSALFYPATWFLFGLKELGGNSLMAWGQTLVVIFHIIWSGIGMALLCRSLRLNSLAQTVGGLAFSLSGYLVARAGFLSINAAVAWLPWILYAGWKVVIKDDGGAIIQSRFSMVRNLILLIFYLTLQLLAGHAQTTYYTFLLLAAWMAFWGWHGQKVRGMLAAAGGLIFAAIAAGILCAIQLLPTAEYLLQSQRASAVGYNLAVNYSFFPLRFLTLIAPNLFGNPAHGDYLLHADNYWEDAVYIGFIPLLAAIGWSVKSIFFNKREHRDSSESWQPPLRALTGFLLVTILVSFILALGKNTPIFPFLYQFVPTFDLFQAPTRFSLLAEFSLALLAAMGIHAWQRPERKAREWTRRGIAVFVAVLLGSGLGILLLTGLKLTFIQATALAGLWGICAGFLSLYLPKREPGKKLWSWAVVFVISLDLLLTGWGLNPGLNSGVYSGIAPNSDQVNSLRNGQRVYLDASSENSLKFDQFFQFNDFTQPVDEGKLLSAMLPDSNMLVKIPSANNFDPILPARYAQWMDYLSSQADTQTRDLMLSLMDVGLVETIDQSALEGVAFKPIQSQRFRWSSCSISASGEEDAWDKTLSSWKLPDDQSGAIILEGISDTRNVACDPVEPAQPVILQETTTSMNLLVQSHADGWLMLSTTWYPGWKAYVDDSETPVLRADYLFMAVRVPEGQHTVSLVYQPDSFSIGGVLSLSGLILIVLVYVFVKK
jgi:hypothetical protein